MADESAPEAQQVAAQEEPEGKEKPVGPAQIGMAMCGACVCLYVFLCSLALMTQAFRVLGGTAAAGLFEAVDDPITGLMTGILATVLVQSSSTSTSIIVALVAEGTAPIKQAIPMIMGANIGTSVTNTIVSMGQAGDRLELERSFAGATVHDMFNLLNVLLWLPLEVIIGAFPGSEGGILFYLSKGMTDLLVDGENGGKFPSPLKEITEPVAKVVLAANKAVIGAKTLDAPRKVPVACNELNVTSGGSCAVMCVPKSLDKHLKKISKKTHAALPACSDSVGDKCSGSQICYHGKDPNTGEDPLGEFYNERVTNGKLVKGGWLDEIPNETVAGVLGLIISLGGLILGLMGLCKALQSVLMVHAKKVIKCATGLNDYVALLLGMVITIAVQSSSVTTSTLTPLCGLGVLPLTKMLPMCLGANIGTTCTALLAAMASSNFASLQIAFVHLLFNILGTAIWYPIPPLRNLILKAARTLGLYASFFRWVPLAYIIAVFFVLPGICLSINLVFDAGLAPLGVILIVLILAGLGVFVYVWNIGIKGEPLSLKVISQEQREEAWKELRDAEAKMAGEEVENSSGTVDNTV